VLFKHLVYFCLYRTLPLVELVLTLCTNSADPLHHWCGASAPQVQMVSGITHQDSLR